MSTGNRDPSDIDSDSRPSTSEKERCVSKKDSTTTTSTLSSISAFTQENIKSLSLHASTSGLSRGDEVYTTNESGTSPATFSTVTHKSPLKGRFWVADDEDDEKTVSPKNIVTQQQTSLSAKAQSSLNSNEITTSLDTSSIAAKLATIRKSVQVIDDPFVPIGTEKAQKTADTDPTAFIKASPISASSKWEEEDLERMQRPIIKTGVNELSHAREPDSTKTTSNISTKLSKTLASPSVTASSKSEFIKNIDGSGWGKVTSKEEETKATTHVQPSTTSNTLVISRPSIQTKTHSTSSALDLSLPPSQKATLSVEKNGQNDLDKNNAASTTKVTTPSSTIASNSTSSKLSSFSWADDVPPALIQELHGPKDTTFSTNSNDLSTKSDQQHVHEKNMQTQSQQHTLPSVISNQQTVNSLRQSPPDMQNNQSAFRGKQENTFSTLPLQSISALMLDEMTPVVSKISLINQDENNNAILFVDEVKGKWSEINHLARQFKTRAVVHVGDFGFYDEVSFQIFSDQELRECFRRTPFMTAGERSNLLSREPNHVLRNMLKNRPGLITELPEFRDGKKTFEVPVYVVHGNQEDVHVVSKFMTKEWQIPNLHIVNPRNAPVIELTNEDRNITGPINPVNNVDNVQHREVIKFRLLGLGGMVMQNRLFDSGHGKHAMASGAQGEMWATILQMGELLETVEKIRSRSEIRVFLCQSPPLVNTLLDLLCRGVNADYSFSGSLHLKYANQSTIQFIKTTTQWKTAIQESHTDITRLINVAFDQAGGQQNIPQRSRDLIKKVIDLYNIYERFSDEDLTNALRRPLHVNLPDSKYGHVMMRPNQQGYIQLDTLSLTINVRDLFHREGISDRRRRESRDNMGKPPYHTREHRNHHHRDHYEASNRLASVLAETSITTRASSATLILSGIPLAYFATPSDVTLAIFSQKGKGPTPESVTLDQKTGKWVTKFKSKEDALRAMAVIDGYILTRDGVTVGRVVATLDA